MKKKRWEHVTDDEVRRHFHAEQLSYRGIASLYEDATIGKVAGRCRTLKLVRGTSPLTGARRPGRGRVVPPPVSLPPKVVKVAVETAKPPPKRNLALVVSIVAQRQETLKKPFKQGRVRLEDLTSSACKWPYGDPRAQDFGFCGCTQAPGFPYCEQHARIAFNPKLPKKVKA